VHDHTEASLAAGVGGLVPWRPLATAGRARNVPQARATVVHRCAASQYIEYQGVLRRRVGRPS
jgi:hypothetical protein